MHPVRAADGSRSVFSAAAFSSEAGVEKHRSGVSDAFSLAVQLSKSRTARTSRTAGCTCTPNPCRGCPVVIQQLPKPARWLDVAIALIPKSDGARGLGAGDRLA